MARDPVWVREVGPLKVSSLFIWPKDQFPLLNKLMLLQKGPKPAAFAHLWMEELIQQKVYRHSEIFPRTNTIIASAPSRGGQPDHAFHMAQLMSKKLNLRHEVGLLQRGPETVTGPQKELAKISRRKIRLLRSEKNSIPENIIFVDDILTTGSTALAAYEALGKPSRFYVFVWAYRPLIADLPIK